MAILIKVESHNFTLRENNPMTDRRNFYRKVAFLLAPEVRKDSHEFQNGTI